MNNLHNGRPLNSQGPLVLLALALASVRCLGQGTGLPVTIRFDGSPVFAPGSAIGVTNYSESGLRFQPVNSGGQFGRISINPVSFRPDNGTAYLQAALTQSLMFSTVNGSLFDLLSVDLAEYSTVVPNAVTVHFIGYYANGSTVTTDFTTDGIIDGTGPLVDFQTFRFDPNAWIGLTRVEIPTSGWSLDNLVVRAPGVPEPTTGALFLLGAGALWLMRAGKRRGQSRVITQTRHRKSDKGESKSGNLESGK